MVRRDFIKLAGVAIGSGALAGTAGAASADKPMDLAAFSAARRFAATSFGRIAYVERGAGAAALFLHGFPLNGFQWRGALDRLSPYRRCIAPDFMGLGFTEPAAGQSVDPDAQVDMLVALLDKLSVASVDLVANDSGGAIAQLFMVRHPQRVRSLLLTNCDTEIDCPPPAVLPVIALAREGKFADEWLGKWKADKTLARSKDGIGGMCYADAAHPTDEAIDCYFGPVTASQLSKAQLHAYAVALERNSLAGIGAALKQSRVPVRVVWGTADVIFSKGSPAFLETAFGNARGVRRLERGKLFWPEERPDVVAAEALALWGIA